MAIPVERVDLSTGGMYDADFRRSYVCGKCGGRLLQAFRDGAWWLRCENDWEHSTFRENPSWSASHRRGENPAADVLGGPLPGNKPLAEDPERLAAGQKRMAAMLATRRAVGHTPETDMRDLFG